MSITPLTINDLGLQAQNFSSITAHLGITTSLQGSFSSFHFGWSSITIHLILSFEVKVCWDITIASDCFDVINIGYNNTFPININFHLGGQHHMSNWLNFDIAFGCGVHLGITPHPHGMIGTNGFTVGSPGGEGAWTITPNPFGIFSSTIIEGVAALTDPLGGGIDGPNVGC